MGLPRFLCNFRDMEPDLSQLPALAASRKKEHRKLFDSLAANPPRSLDRVTSEIHQEVFAETDCLQCANCCKTAGPLLITQDIERLARHFRMKASAFTETYLRQDEDGDWVMRSLPCPFLGEDNFCQIYDLRPRACREYPHTDRRRLYQIRDLTLRNVAICPAAYRIVEKIKELWAAKEIN